MPNPIVHFEIGCRDRGKTGAFYSALFDWSIQEQGPASNIDTRKRRAPFPAALRRSGTSRSTTRFSTCSWRMSGRR